MDGDVSLVDKVCAVFVTAVGVIFAVGVLSAVAVVGLLWWVLSTSWIDGSPPGRQPKPEVVQVPPKLEPAHVSSSPLPELLGAGAARAQSTLVVAGFNTELRTALGSSPMPGLPTDRWVVCAMNPPPGRKALRGTVITLVVSDRGCA